MYRKIVVVLIIHLFLVCNIKAQDAKSSTEKKSDTALSSTKNLAVVQEDSVVKNKKIIFEESPWTDRRFTLIGGLFVPFNNTNIQVGINGGQDGTEINPEKDLGFHSSVATYLAGLQWRISKRSKLGLTFYNIRRSSTTTLKKDINFEGTLYPVNTAVKFYFNTAIYQFSYVYYIIAKPRLDLGILIGGHIIGASTGISENNIGNNKTNDFGFTAPLPDVGISARYAFNRRLSGFFDISYFSLTSGNNSGRLIASDLLISYRLIDRLSLGLGYSGLNFRLQSVKDDYKGDLSWGYNGPTLSAIFFFGKKIKSLQ